MVERGEIYGENLDPKSGTEINKVEHHRLTSQLTKYTTCDFSRMAHQFPMTY